ncbi:hypothetical protein [Flavobacterium sp.]|uniref:hypothetical protein n=3 Tax=Flavobacterium sp. TaxID=239 RepID=UPI00404761A6
MKKFKIFYLLLIISNFINSQDIKTFKGEYKNGIAEYEYVDNGIDREFNGKFILSTKKDTIKCNFVKNKLKGNYSRKNYLSVEPRYHDQNKEIVYKLNYSSEGEIKNNKKNGVWKYSFLNKECKIYDKSDLKEYKIDHESISFKNDTIVGKIDFQDKKQYSYKDSEHDYNINGEFDIEGKFTGTIYRGKGVSSDTLNYIDKYDIYKSVLYTHYEYDKLKNKFLKIYKMDLDNIKKITQSNSFYVNDNLSSKLDNLNIILNQYFQFISKSIEIPVDASEFNTGEKEEQFNKYYFENIRIIKN